MQRRLAIMADEPDLPSPKGGAELSQAVGVKSAPSARPPSQPTRGWWFGLGQRGLVAWAVVMPVLVGAGMGLWLDTSYPAAHSWMILLMAIGLALGCFNGWRQAGSDRRTKRAASKAGD